MIRHADGSFDVLIESSTRPTTVVVTHPGVAKTRRFSFAMP
jgi:hypothetical protein